LPIYVLHAPNRAFRGLNCAFSSLNAPEPLDGSAGRLAK